jgi:hypothetical protein
VSNGDGKVVGPVMCSFRTCPLLAVMRFRARNEDALEAAIDLQIGIYADEAIGRWKMEVEEMKTLVGKLLRKRWRMGLLIDGKGEITKLGEGKSWNLSDGDGCCCRMAQGSSRVSE